MFYSAFCRGSPRTACGCLRRGYWGQYEWLADALVLGLGFERLHHVIEALDQILRAEELRHPQEEPERSALDREVEPEHERCVPARLRNDALNKRINISPGHLFSVKDRYTNCLRMSCGLPWSDEIEAALKTLGDLIKKQL